MAIIFFKKICKHCVLGLAGPIKAEMGQNWFISAIFAGISYPYLSISCYFTFYLQIRDIYIIIRTKLMLYKMAWYSLLSFLAYMINSSSVSFYVRFCQKSKNTWTSWVPMCNLAIRPKDNSNTWLQMNDLLNKCKQTDHRNYRQLRMTTRIDTWHVNQGFRVC